MTDDEMIHSVHYRLGEPDETLEWAGKVPEAKRKKPDNQLCPLCGTKMNQYHYENCQVNGPIRSARHNIIKRLLGNFFTKIPFTKIIMEDYTQKDSAAGIARIPDLTISIRDPVRKITYLERMSPFNLRANRSLIHFSADLIVSNIFATSNAHFHKQGKYAEAGEHSKVEAYKYHNKHAPVKVLPFAISSVCEFAPQALSILDFIQEMGRRNNRKMDVTSIIQHISLLLETTRREMERSYLAALQRKTPNFLGWVITKDAKQKQPVSVQMRAVDINWEERYLGQDYLSSLANDDERQDDRTTVHDDTPASTPSSSSSPSPSTSVHFSSSSPSSTPVHSASSSSFSLLSLLSPVSAVRTPSTSDFSGQGRERVREAGYNQDQTKSSLRENIRNMRQKGKTPKWSTQIGNTEVMESASESKDEQDKDQFSSSSSNYSDSDQSSSFTSHVLWRRKRVRRTVKHDHVQKQHPQHTALTGQELKSVRDSSSEGRSECQNSSSSDDSGKQERDDEESSEQQGSVEKERRHPILTQYAISQYFAPQTGIVALASQAAVTAAAEPPQLSQQLSPIPFPQTQVQEQDAIEGSQ